MRVILNRPAVLVLAVTLALAACGTEGADDSDEAGGSGGDLLVATTTIWADISSHVVCDAPVPALIPEGADPHTFEASLRDREIASGARTVIANGGGLEASLDDLLDAVAAEGVDVVEMTAHVDVLTGDDGTGDHDEHDHTDEDDGTGDHDEHDHTDDGTGDHDEHDHTDEETGDHDEHDHANEETGDHDEHDHADEETGDHDEHDHAEGADPHIWQDPRRVAGALDAIASAAIAAGFDAASITECTDRYRDQLLALDDEIAEELSHIATEDRVLVTSHESLAYYADRYDLTIVGTVIPGTSTLSETNAADLATLADEIARLGVPAIFTDRLSSSVDADALAARLGVEVVPLTTDALTADPARDTYVEMLRSNTSAIAEALEP